MPLDDFKKKIGVLSDFDIVKETMEIINLNAQYLETLLKQQLQAGRDGKNQPVTVFGRDQYRPLTIEIKQSYGFGLGAITNRITNYFQGNFYSSIFLKTSGTNFEFDSELDYFQDIIRQSGKQIMDLNKENLEIFSKEILIPELQKRFSEKWNS